MKPPRDLQEFAERLRTHGTSREADFGNEILEYVVLDDVVNFHYELCESLEQYAPDIPGDAARQAEWLGDRSNLLGEIEKELEEAKRKGDVDDEIKDMLATLEDVRLILDAQGFEGVELIQALEELAERASRAPEETEVLTYDL